MPHAFPLRCQTLSARQLRRTVSVFCCLLSISASLSSSADDSLFRRVANVLEERCVSCHNSQDSRGGLSLQSRTALLEGGDSGSALLPGNAKDSMIVQMIIGQQPEMPKDSSPLEDADIAAISDWIAAGAVWPEEHLLEVPKQSSTDWWAFYPLERPELPTSLDNQLGTEDNPIDHFIVAALQRHGLQQSPEADRRTLIRRVTFDLIGLPPTFEEVVTFCSDPDPMAYHRLVDRLLDSPHYGERWARHWLDVVHYGETHGYDKDQPRPNAWPYRDYVIRALNEDKPYARFVQEQIAGDVLYPNTLDGIAALGFIAAGPWDLIGHAEVPETKMDGKVARHLDRDDMVSNTINTFQSITVHCAQCHDHKFDPVSQRDYYALQANFAALDRAERTFEIDPVVAHQRSELLDERQTLEEGDRRAEVERLLAALPPPMRVYCGTIHTGNGHFVGTGASGGKPRLIRVLARGDVNLPLDEALPGTLSYFPELAEHFHSAPDDSEGQRRAALARWLSDRRNSLTWRSIVNRVWLYHFGRGIVDTPNDFGRMGDPPSHPELLDWLAVWFRDDAGGSMKKLHRLIVTSRTYRQSSSPERDSQHPAIERDAANSLLWRQNRRKLEAEAIRDSLLEVSGKLDTTMGGPSFQDFVVTHPEHSPHFEYHLADLEDPQLHRRSVYRFIVRSQQQPWMATLDCADPSVLVDKRNQTNTPLQALAQLNNQLVLVMSKHFAERILQISSEPELQVEMLYRIGLQRDPTVVERQEMASYVRKHGLPNACRLLVNLNEFVFVD